MKLSDYLSTHGSQTELARAIGAQPQLVWQWSTGVRPVPIERCVPIERATNGAVTRIDLRPDDWRDIWPELDEGQAGTKNIASQWA
jgi:DNA-binding transcriptional regulator YdaS (Cro superfamily)